MKRNRRGQSTAEYAIVISVVIAAVVGMQLYMKRGMQGKVKDGVDYFAAQTGDMGVGNNISTLDQYEPYYAVSDVNTFQESSETEEMVDGGGVRKTNAFSRSKRSGTQDQGVDWDRAGENANWDAAVH